MKKLITIHIAILFFLSGSVFSQNKYNLYDQESPMHTSPKLKGGSLWGDFNMGYSTQGLMGVIALSYRKGNLYVGTAYYKSHICYHGTEHHNDFQKISNSQEHKTVQSISVLWGIIFPGKLAPSLSVGVSWLQLDYQNTIPIEKNLTSGRIWETIIGSDYKNEWLATRRINTIGIPIGINLHFSPKHFVGVDAMVNANLNMQSLIFSAGLGIHLGRILPRS